jgi:hypothetical protein
MRDYTFIDFPEDENPSNFITTTYKLEETAFFDIHHNSKAWSIAYVNKGNSYVRRVKTIDFYVWKDSSLGKDIKRALEQYEEDRETESINAFLFQTMFRNVPLKEILDVWNAEIEQAFKEGKKEKLLEIQEILGIT